MSAGPQRDPGRQPAAPAAAPDAGQDAPTPERRPLLTRLRMLVYALEEDDEAMVEAVLRLSRSRRLFAPLALMVGAFAMLIDGVRLLLSNWRLTLVQILPAMWIWIAMYDLKAHVLHGRTFHGVRGPVLIPVVLAIVAVTAACFFLNAVFAYAVALYHPPRIRPAFGAARAHLRPILLWGCAVGLMLGLSTTVAARAGRPWFVLSQGAVVAVMMLCYVAVPSRLIGIRPSYSRRDKMTATALGSTIGVTVCTPPYLLGRIGILMLGSKVLFVPGLIVFALGATLQAGATGAVRAVKMSAALAAGSGSSDAERPAGPA